MELLKANGYHDVFGDRSVVLVPDFNFEKKELMASNFYPEYCDLVIRSSKLEIIKMYHTVNILSSEFAVILALYINHYASFGYTGLILIYFFHSLQIY